MLDFYLGSDIGLWVLEQVSPQHIERIFTFDRTIAARAEAMGVPTYTQNANEVPFTPAQMGISVHYPRLIREPLIRQYRKLYNLHPSYLPWGRGYYPVFWALWEGTPAGATLHEITAGLDEGPIVAQVEVPYTEQDTGYTLFERVRAAEKALFLDYFPRIVAGIDLPSYPQPSGGSYHSKKDFLELKRCAHWRALDSATLVRLIRCLSFPQYTGLEIVLDGTLFSLKLEAVE